MVAQQTTASGSITLNRGSSVVSRLATDAGGGAGGRLGSLGPASSSVVANQGSLQHVGSLVQAPSLACSVSAPPNSSAQQRRVASVASLSNLQAAASAQAASPPQPQTLAAMQQHQVCLRAHKPR